MNSERRGAAVQSAHVFHGGFDLRCDEIRCGRGRFYKARGDSYTRSHTLVHSVKTVYWYGHGWYPLPKYRNVTP